MDNVVWAVRAVWPGRCGVVVKRPRAVCGVLRCVGLFGAGRVGLDLLYAAVQERWTVWTWEVTGLW